MRENEQKRTPETDAAALGFARVMVDHEKSTVTELVEANYARKLERQRDELANALRDMVCAYTATGGPKGSLIAAAYEQARAALAKLS